MARSLVECGHEVTLITASADHWYRSQCSEIDGITVLEGPSWNPILNRDDGWNPLDIAYRFWKVLFNSYDLIYAFAHPPNIYFPMRLAQILRGKPVIADWCDDYADALLPMRAERRILFPPRPGRSGLFARCDRIEASLERKILLKANAVTVISQGLEEKALGLGVSQDNLLRVHGGANLERFRPLDKAQCRQELGLDESGPIFGYVANYNPDEKLLLDAFSLVIKKNPKVRILARCPVFDPDLLRDRQVSDRITFLDRVPYSKIPTVLGAADAHLLPMSNSAHNQLRWPQKFGDYLASGRPILSNAVGDTYSFYQGTQGQRIGIASACTPEAYADAMMEFLDNPQWWQSMRDHARKIAEQQLDWRKMIEAVNCLISKIAS